MQVGDPFTEKLLIEACLELMQGDAIVAIQDMGAAGLTSSSVEMAGKGGLGITLDLDQVPVRETGMTAYEIMLSESQERMLMVLRPGSEAEARRIFEKWELDFAVIGRITDSGRLDAADESARSPVPTSVKFETVLAALKRRKNTRTGPIVVVMLEVILTRATAKLKLGTNASLLGKNTIADPSSSWVSALSNVSPLVIRLGLLRWSRTV